MTLDQFISSVSGTYLDYDGSAGYQCVDVAKAYMKKCLGINQFSIGSAKNYWERYNKIPELKNNFTRISNGKDFLPQKGDICIFKGTADNKHGHVCIATGRGLCQNKSTDYFYSLDQNYGTDKRCRIVKHNFKNFYGVLRPKKG